MQVVTMEELARFGEELAGRLAERLSVDLHPKRLLRIEEAARILGISRGKVYALANSGAVPAVRIGGTRLIPVGLLNDYIDSLHAAALGGALTRSDGDDLRADGEGNAAFLSDIRALNGQGVA